MLTSDHLKKYSVSVLKKEISKSNIKGYSKMKRGDLVALMLENQDKFMYLKEDSHVMPDGKVMSGAVHSKESKVVKSKSGKVFKVNPKKEANKESVDFLSEYKKKFPDAKKKVEAPKKVEPPKKKTPKQEQQEKFDIILKAYNTEDDKLLDKVLKELSKQPNNFFDKEELKSNKSYQKIYRKIKQDFKTNRKALLDKHGVSTNRYVQRVDSQFRNAYLKIRQDKKQIN